MTDDHDYVAVEVTDRTAGGGTRRICHYLLVMQIDHSELDTVMAAFHQGEQLSLW